MRNSSLFSCILSTSLRVVSLGGFEMRTFPLAGKIAIVTGAASGIGLAIARQFIREGARVVVEDIDPKIETQFADDENVAALVADAGKEESAIAAVDLAKSRFGKVDILVNNAARIVYKPVVEMTLANWNSILDVTSTGVFLHSREALKAMIPHKSGAIINIGSYACAQTFPG